MTYTSEKPTKFQAELRKISAHFRLFHPKWLTLHVCRETHQFPGRETREVQTVTVRWTPGFPASW